MTQARSLTRFLVVAALCGASNGFAPQPLASKAASVTKSLSSPSALNVWNPFVRAEDLEPVAVEVVKEEPVPGPIATQNYVAGAVWASLIVWGFFLAPGEAGSASDNAMIQTLITQPTPRPEEINQLWFAVWNCFVVVPAVIGALEAPVGRGQRLPAAPFLLGSAFLGYFSLGPYFLSRTVRTDPVDVDDLGFASRNIFESKIFGGLLAAIAISIPFSSDVFTCDLASTFAGYIDLATSSRFVAVASADIAIMSILAGILVSEDATRRGWEDKALPLGAASILLPVLGPCLYLVARPSLEESLEE
jgi:hypothetical protein